MAEPSTPPSTGPSASGPAPDWRSLHLWQIQPVRDALLLAALIGVIYLGYVLRVVTVPLLLAGLLAYLLEPVVRFVTRQGRGPVSREGAAAGLILATVLIISVPVAGGITFGVVQGASWVKEVGGSLERVRLSVESPEDARLSARVEELGPKWVKIRNGLVDLRNETEKVRQQQAGTLPDDASPPNVIAAHIYSVLQTASDWVQTNAQSISKQALQTGAGAVGIVVSIFGSLFFFGFSAFLTAFFFFFVCTGWGRVLKFWEGLIPEKRKGPVIDMVNKMDGVIAGFIRGRLTISAIFMVFFTVCYWIIGAPVPLIIGPLVGLLCIVPYAATGGMLLVILLMWLDTGKEGFMATWWWAVGAPIVVHSINQVLDDYVLTPAIQGKSTNMDTPTILFASLAGGILAGFYGLLVAIPVAACIKILLNELILPRVRAWAEGRAPDPLPLGKP